MTLEYKALESIMERENAGNQFFLLFPQCFLPCPKQSSSFESPLWYYLQMLSIWPGLKFVIGKDFSVVKLLTFGINNNLEKKKNSRNDLP